MQRKELVSLLKGHNVPLGDWGKKVNERTIDDLLKEIREGVSIVHSQNRKVIRRLRDVHVNVFLGKPCSQQLHLLPVTGGSPQSLTFMAKMLCKDDDVTSRGDKVRCFLQSLGIQEGAEIIEHPLEAPKLKNSHLYPGLKILKTVHHFSVYVTNGVYSHAGYQSMENTSYTWKPTASDVIHPVPARVAPTIVLRTMAPGHSTKQVGRAEQPVTV